MPRVAVHLLIMAWVCAPRPALANVTDWQLSEIVIAYNGEAAARFIELEHLGAGCLYPSSRIEVYGGDGSYVGAAALVSQTTCHGAATYLLLATPQAAAALMVTADLGVVPALPNPGQACFSSSGTRYDCVRWGAVTNPITDFFGPDDLSLAPAPSGPLSLARRASDHRIATDWQLAAPSPRGPNDGTPWSPPDAGVMDVADAGGPVDAGAPGDARTTADAAPPAPDAGSRPDAGGRFLDLKTGGGGCTAAPGPRSGDGGLAAAIAGLAIALCTVLRRRERTAAPRS